jgi:hypothetical protein
VRKWHSGIPYVQVKAFWPSVCKTVGSAYVGSDQAFAASAGSAKGAAIKTALAAAAQRHKALLAIGWHIAARVEMPSFHPRRRGRALRSPSSTAPEPPVLNGRSHPDSQHPRHT